jgi:hypothetical protein
MILAYFCMRTHKLNTIMHIAGKERLTEGRTKFTGSRWLQKELVKPVRAAQNSTSATENKPQDVAETVPKGAAGKRGSERIWKAYMKPLPVLVWVTYGSDACLIWLRVISNRCGLPSKEISAGGHRWLQDLEPQVSGRGPVEELPSVQQPAWQASSNPPSRLVEEPEAPMLTADWLAFQELVARVARVDAPAVRQRAAPRPAAAEPRPNVAEAPEQRPGSSTELAAPSSAPQSQLIPEDNWSKVVVATGEPKRRWSPGELLDASTLGAEKPRPARSRVPGTSVLVRLVQEGSLKPASIESQHRPPTLEPQHADTPFQHASRMYSQHQARTPDQRGLEAAFQRGVPQESWKEVSRPCEVLGDNRPSELPWRSRKPLKELKEPRSGRSTDLNLYGRRVNTQTHHRPQWTGTAASPQSDSDRLSRPPPKPHVLGADMLETEGSSLRWQGTAAGLQPAPDRLNRPPSKPQVLDAGRPVTQESSPRWHENLSGGTRSWLQKMHPPPKTEPKDHEAVGSSGPSGLQDSPADENDNQHGHGHGHSAERAAHAMLRKEARLAAHRRRPVFPRWNEGSSSASPTPAQLVPPPPQPLTPPPRRKWLLSHVKSSPPAAPATKDVPAEGSRKDSQQEAASTEQSAAVRWLLADRLSQTPAAEEQKPRRDWSRYAPPPNSLASRSFFLHCATPCPSPKTGAQMNLAWDLCRRATHASLQHRNHPVHAQ